MKTINEDILKEITGGGLYDDAPLEVILEKAEESAIMLKKNGKPLSYAQDMLSRYYSVPGRVEREVIVPVIQRVYAVQ